jgi:hypothetical protein
MRLLFVLSLPRSGSTFLAKTLVTHPQITSSCFAEPHLFVSAFAPLSRMKTLGSYGAVIAFQSAMDYLSSTELGQAGYKASIGALIEKIYFSSAVEKDATYFVEKTTRNSLIAEDLIAALPDARFLILWRNPLDVMASVYSTWCRDRWTWNANSVELFSGLESLVEALNKHPDRILALKYEDLVNNPEATLSCMSAFLDLEPALSSERQDLALVQFTGPHDPYAQAASNQTAHNNSVAKWRKSIVTRRRRRMARRYIDWIGRERLGIMGYDLSELRNHLDALDPPLATSVAEDLRMEGLTLKRILTVSTWHFLNEARAFSKNALR